MTLQALTRSMLLHGVLVLLAGCAIHKHLADVPQLSPEVMDGRDMVAAIGSKMPLWDEDPISRYERTEIATVKADIMVAETVDNESDFLAAVKKLHKDWDQLVMLDEFLKHNLLT